MKSKCNPPMTKQSADARGSGRGFAPAVAQLAWVGVLALAACQTKPPPAIEDASALEVQAFVRQTFIHGVPYEAARQFNAGAVPVLWQMLADPAEERHWPNIAVTLAIVGEEGVGEGLIDFVRADQDGVLSPGHYAAKTAALMALGYHVHHTKDRNCLDYLARCADPAYWHALDLQWHAPFPQSAEERNDHLATLAVIGIALSGSPRPMAGKAALTLSRSTTAPTSTTPSPCCSPRSMTCAPRS